MLIHMLVITKFSLESIARPAHHMNNLTCFSDGSLSAEEELHSPDISLHGRG